MTPSIKNEKFFSSTQEGRRKDLERLFGVLQSRFEILRKEMRNWDLIDIVDISNTCVFIHNMIVKMQQEGLFHDKAGNTNVVTELIDNQ